MSSRGIVARLCSVARVTVLPASKNGREFRDLREQSGASHLDSDRLHPGFGGLPEDTCRPAPTRRMLRLAELAPQGHGSQVSDRSVDRVRQLLPAGAGMPPQRHRLIRSPDRPVILQARQPHRAHLSWNPRCVAGSIAAGSHAPATGKKPH